MKNKTKYIIIAIMLFLSFAFTACVIDEEPVISFTEKEITMTVGDNVTLAPTVTVENATVSFTSSDETLATVTNEGVVTALKDGTVTISAKCQDDTATVTITINPAGYSISFEHSSVTLTVGEKFVMNVISDKEGLDYTFSSSNEEVVTINRYGRLSGISIGEATVTVTDGTVSATASVSVKAVPEVDIVFNLNYYTDEVLTEKIHTTIIATTGTKIEAPAIPVREGFVFDGWFKENTLRNSFDFETEEVVGDMVLYAKWHKAALFTISFDEETVGVVESKVYLEGSDLSAMEPATPTKLGYYFRAWYTDAELTKEFDFETSVVNSSVKIYAGWDKDPSVIIVTYYNGETVYDQYLQEINSKVEKKDYVGANANEFTAWIDENGNEYNFNRYATSDVTLYAKFSLKLGAGQTAIEDGQFEGDLTLVDVEIADTVTELGVGAFADCINIKTVIIPASVTSISADCFKGCEGLTSITYLGQLVGISEGAFYGCTSLKEANIPSTVVSIGSEAFAYCSGLENVTLPESVLNLGAGAFMGCTSLKTASLSSKITVIERNLFRGCISLSMNVPSTITEVREYGFYNTNVAGEVTNKIVVLGAYSFYGCQNLTSVTISKDVESVGDYAFYNCINVSKLVFETGEDNTSNLRSIGVASFASMTKVEEILLPEGLTSILDDSFRYNFGAFSNNTALKKVYIPSTITTYGFDGGNGSAMFYNCTSLTDVELAEGLTTLGTHMFHWCTSLETITIPSSVTSMGGYIFYECTSLKEVNIDPSSKLESIQSCSFRGCTSLTSLTIPDSVRSIGANAFNKCTNLSRINSDVDGTFILPKSISLFSGTGIFAECTKLVNITIDSDSDSIEFDQYASSMFMDCTSLQSVVFGDAVSIDTIPNSMFEDCSSLVNIVLPQNLKGIGRHAFNGCTSLESFVLPNTVETLGGGSTTERGIFRNCTSLKTFVFEEGSKLTYISPYMFSGCTSLETIIIPDSIETIGQSAFRESGLINFSVKSSASKLSSFGEYAFYKATSLTTVSIYNTIKVYESSVFSNCTSLVTVGMTQNVAEIGSAVEELATIFSSCTSLKKVQLNCTNITSLPAGFFNSCYALESVNSDEVGVYNIPAEIDYIGPTVFRYNYKVQTINFFGNITYFGLYSMDYCTSLSSIKIHKNVTNVNEVPTTNSCFSGSDILARLDFKVYVPSSSLTYYQNSDNWLANGYVKYLSAF